MTTDMPESDGTSLEIEGTIAPRDGGAVLKVMIHDLPRPPTLGEIVDWLDADPNHTVEMWSVLTGTWTVYGDLLWRYLVGDCPARADEPQPGYRLATRTPKIRPEVQAVRDLGDLSDAEAEHLDVTLDARLRDSLAEDGDPEISRRGRRVWRSDPGDVDPPDPWETCKVGDPEPGDVWPGGPCGLPIDPDDPDRYVCTRRPTGHSGRHVAVDLTGHVVAVEETP